MEAAPVKLSLRGVDVRYARQGREHTAVQDISFDVRAGEKLMILGPSGCGKSTLLKAIAGFIRPSRGEVLLDGTRVTGPGPDRMVVFQEFDQLLPWQTVLGNVLYGVRVACRLPRAQCLERAAHFLRMVGLEGYEHFYPHTLSGGMKQRAAIARSLAIDPQVLLMDEPFAALDAQTRLVLQQELDRIWAETRKTIVFVTHSIEEAIALGHRIVVLSPGPGRVRAVLDVERTGDLAADAVRHQELRRGILELLQSGRAAAREAAAAAG